MSSEDYLRFLSWDFLFFIIFCKRMSWIFSLIFAHQNFPQNLDQSLILSLLRGPFGFSALGRAPVLAGSTAPLLSSFLENPSKLRNVYSAKFLQDNIFGKFF